MATLTYTGSLVTTSCWCGIHLAIPTTLDSEARDSGKSLYCPLGHTFVYGETYKEQLAATKQRLEAERRRVQATRELLHQEERSHSATRGHLTRHKKRASAGVCPCCQRTFQQLARHMKSKHPSYAAD